ncbi:MAG: NAD(P)-dependent alcohol dehydrogenase [Legionellales bacterium]|nr:NAD(P)-dependent alcohol dehydrogenase [Legionellales bacterium]
MIECKGYAAQNAKSPLQPFSFTRRDVRDNDVLIEITHCGVCHSDIHMARNEWGMSLYPMVPGHEIVGKVVKVGSRVHKFKVGDHVGVGCMVDSCQQCHYCHEHLEQYCEKGMTMTYGSKEAATNTLTQGGYSNNIVVREEFVLKIADNLSLSHVAPLLCAGITTYSPLRRWNVGKGSKVGVVGLGGLGHMAIKLAHSMGAEVTLFTRSSDKANDAMELGAHHVILSNDRSQMAKAANSLDFILDTVSATHEISPYLNALTLEGSLVFVGVPEQPQNVSLMPLIFTRRQMAGSLIGGIRETQEMLDYCAQHNILPEIEMINIDQINHAFDRILKSDVKYRFVIDMKSL